MKQFYTMVATLLAATSAFAGITTTQLNAVPQRVNAPKTTQLKYVTSNGLEKSPAIAKVAPASIVGNEYVVQYTYSTDNMNLALTVSEGEEAGTLVFEGLAEGYDLTGTYDASTGKISIPTNVVIGNNSTYGDITLWALSADGTQYSDSPITATVDGDEIIFDNGIYSTVVYNGDNAGWNVMMNITGKMPNGHLAFTSGTTNFNIPLLVTRTDTGNIEVIGISNVLYGYTYPVNIGYELNAAETLIPFGTTIDYYPSAKKPYVTGGRSSSGLTDLPLTIATTDSSTTLTGTLPMAYVYNTTGTSYSGYVFNNPVFNIDFNIFTAPITETDTPCVDDINYELNRDDMTATVTGCSGSLTVLDIPAVMTYAGNSYDVKSIAATSFQSNTKLLTVKFPSSITTVGTDAFRACSNISQLYIEDLTSWCAVEFANGNANPLYNVFPTSQTKWGNVYIAGENIKESLVIPDGIEKIGRSFYGFKALQSVTLPSSLTYLGDQAFANNISLTEVTVPGELTYAGSAFFSCSGLTKATFSGSVKEIKNTFYGCSNLENVELGDALETVGIMSFNGCAALKSLSFPASLTSIQMMALDGCSALEELTCSAVTPPTVESGVFDDINKEIPIYVPESSIDSYKAADEWKEFTNYQKIDTGVAAIEVEQGMAKYFDLNGVETSTPQNGIYVRVANGKATKVIVK